MRLKFNFNLYTGGKLKISQSFNGFVGRSDYINKPFVRSRFKLLAAVLIFMNGAENGNNLFFGGQRHGA